MQPATTTGGGPYRVHHLGYQRKVGDPSGVAAGLVALGDDHVHAVGRVSHRLLHVAAQRQHLHAPFVGQRHHLFRISQPHRQHPDPLLQDHVELALHHVRGLDFGPGVRAPGLQPELLDGVVHEGHVIGMGVLQVLPDVADVGVGRLRQPRQGDVHAEGLVRELPGGADALPDELRLKRASADDPEAARVGHRRHQPGRGRGAAAVPAHAGLDDRVLDAEHVA